MKERDLKVESGKGDFGAGQRTKGEQDVSYTTDARQCAAALSDKSSGIKLKERLESYGPRFGIYGKDGSFVERCLPFDPLPRIIDGEQFEKLERGLIQRVTALNLFLCDIYSDCRILKDNVIPASFVLSSQGFIARCVGIRPRKGIYAHIAGIDLVKSKAGEWFVLEDNLRVPSGASYPLLARRVLRECGMSDVGACDSLYYGDMLKDALNYVSAGGINALLTSGSGNSAYYEHCALAEATGSALCYGGDLYVDNDVLYFKGAEKVERVGALYSRVSEVFADPLAFRRTSALGVPNLFSAYAAGNVALSNAFGAGVADDKGVYYFVPKLIEYYLGEQPLLKNAPTFLPYYPDDLKYVCENLPQLVVKEVAESGGYGVVFAGNLSKQELRALCRRIKAEPRRFIAQEIIDFEDMQTYDGLRKADFRAFVVSGEKTRVWKGGLTRYAGDESSFIVNSSQGGGFKDTWVLSR